MPNSSTLVGTNGLNINYFEGKVSAYTVVLDTLGADLTIMTPPADERWAIVGLIYNESTAHDLTIKSGTTTVVVLEKAINVFSPQLLLGAGILATAIEPGQLLCLRTSAAITSPLLVYVAQYKHIAIR